MAYGSARPRFYRYQLTIVREDCPSGPHPVPPLLVWQAGAWETFVPAPNDKLHPMEMAQAEQFFEGARGKMHAISRSEREALNERAQKENENVIPRRLRRC